MPVIADYNLNPGERVGVSEDGTKTDSGSANHVGIVDPFLTQRVKQGETFWLFLFQGSVHTLRHEWTHPAFPTGTERPGAVTVMQVAEAWLRDYAIKLKPYEGPKEAYDNLIEGFRQKEIHGHGKDVHCLSDVDDADLLMMHAEVVLGFRPDLNDPDFGFSCSC